MALVSLVNQVSRPRADVNSTTTWGTINSALTTPTNTGGYGARVYRATASGAGSYGASWPTTDVDRPVAIPEQMYIVRTKFVTIQATRTAGFQIDWYDVDHILLDTEASPLSATLGERAFATVAPADSDHAIIKVVTNDGAAGNLLEFDGLSFVATEDIAEPYSDGDSLFWRWMGTQFQSKSESFAVAKELYNRLAPLAWEDDQHGFALAHLCTAMMLNIQETENLARDVTVGGKQKIGWSALFDLQRIPDKAVPWLAQLVGVAAPRIAGESDSAYAYRLKPLIRSRTGWQRGTAAAIATAAGYWLTGQKRVTFRERTPTPYTVQIRTLQSETPNQAAVIREIKSVKPGGIVLDYEALPGQDWAQVAANNTDWNDVNATFANWNSVRNSWPS